MREEKMSSGGQGTSPEELADKYATVTSKTYVGFKPTGEEHTFIDADTRESFLAGYRAAMAVRDGAASPVQVNWAKWNAQHEPDIVADLEVKLAAAEEKLSVAEKALAKIESAHLEWPTDLEKELRDIARETLFKLGLWPATFKSEGEKNA